MRSGPYERCYDLENSFYVDADCDGAGSAISTKVPCDDGMAPIGYSWSNSDCDDTDPTKRQLYNRDADGDGVGSRSDTICAGAQAPRGYVVEMGRGDCDDGNPAISYPYHLDADGDGVPAPNAPIVCGPKGQPPPNASFIFCGEALSICDDCDDTDPTVRTSYYQDLDGDGYATSTEVSVCGNPDIDPPQGFGILGDCDDHRADVHPKALDLWTDGVDADCDGRIAPYANSCTSVETCTPAWFTIPIDSTCASADLIISVDVSTYCGESTWIAWIGNQGTAPLLEYALTIEDPSRTMVFPIRDPLPPGAQYPYRMPTALRLSDTVRFSVTIPPADCNPSNNTTTQWTAGYGPCPL